MGDQKIRLFYTSVTGNAKVRANQTSIQSYLEAKKIPFEKIDIADPSNQAAKDFMFENAQPEEGCKGKPLMPQLFIDDEYLGDYSKFQDANENECMTTFLRQPPSADGKN